MSDRQSYVRYDDSVEVPFPDEAEFTRRVLESMGRMRSAQYEKHRHAIRDAHAKSHGVLKGTLAIHGGLAPELSQGLFARPATYPIVVRLSTSPSVIQTDAIGAPRGFAMKIIGVEGPKVLPENTGDVTQDFLLINAPTLPFADVESYLKAQLLNERRTHAPEAVSKIISKVGIGLNTLTQLAGRKNKLLEAIATPNTHILGHTYFSAGALRYGDYIAKLSIVPVSENVRALAETPVDLSTVSPIRDMAAAFFKRSGAEYELRVQLCTDLEKMPVEDVSVAWDEALSPFRPVGRISFPVQDIDTPTRRVSGDDALSFNPWHCLQAHRPLGNIMRIRRHAYDASARYRRSMNVQPAREPAVIAEIPD